MKTTIEFLDAIKSRHGLQSDYAIAKFLKLPTATVSRYRNGRNHFDDSIALRVAKALEIEPLYVIACSHAERTSTPEVKEIWRQMADNFLNHARGLSKAGDTLQNNPESRNIPLCKIEYSPLLTAIL